MRSKQLRSIEHKTSTANRTRDEDNIGRRQDNDDDNDGGGNDDDDDEDANVILVESFAIYLYCSSLNESVEATNSQPNRKPARNVTEKQLVFSLNEFSSSIFIWSLSAVKGREAATAEARPNTTHLNPKLNLS
ncbi:hypothetical protein AWZ03_001807 [Drosophila navojoa]|uniref:Uncharacterized protein n=1 Tax=Drosophila navojoa TaxID=7232 RepID=A0A484BSJ3_DRONA|nr:hypothetical protein AWZ03_001807 [Drosophila navojoa]